MDDLHYSGSLRRIVNMAHEEAIRLLNNSISPDHLMLAILHDERNIAAHYLIRMRFNLSAFEDMLKKSLENQDPVYLRPSEKSLPYDSQAESVLQYAQQEAQRLEAVQVNEAHLLIALAEEAEGVTYDFLQQSDQDVADWVRAAIKVDSPHQQYFGHNKPEDKDDDDEDDTPHNLKRRFRGLSSSPLSSSSEDEDEDDDDNGELFLENYSVDITSLARKGLLDPIVGRENELERLSQILCRRKKNNPVIIGEPGVGKSALVEGLAQRIAADDVPIQLKNKRIMRLDMTSVVAGTKFRGQFEERMMAIIEQLKSMDNTILYVDELHTIVGAGSAAGTLDAANILKPWLARGEFQCIGSTTLDDYRSQIESDKTLERRFQKILLHPCSEEESLRILERVKDRYEEHHNVTYTQEALKACVALTVRYVTDRSLPDKALDAMDEAGARMAVFFRTQSNRVKVIDELISDAQNSKQRFLEERKVEIAQQELQKIRRLEATRKEVIKEEQASKVNIRLQVTEDTVAEVVSMMTNIPVQRVVQSEGERLLKMDEELKRRVVGQDDAISSISRAIRRNRSGLKDPNRPIGTFLFLGPTGVGKTHLAKKITEYLFDKESNLIRIDMSEYMERHSVSRLIGSPPGYVGYGEGGQLTEQVRRRPYSVVLLDEIEKAAPEIYNLLLQMLDEGHMTDSNGRQVDFKNTLIIMTSNVGSRALSEFGDGVGFATSARIKGMRDRRRKYIMDALNRQFPPEFVNRVDELIFFEALTKDEIAKILDIELAYIYERLEDHGVTLLLTESAKEFLVSEGYDEKYGARPLKRAIQRYVEDIVAEVLLRADGEVGLKITLDYSEKKGMFSKQQPPSKKLVTATK